MNSAVLIGFTIPWKPPGRPFPSLLEDKPSNSVILKVWIDQFDQPDTWKHRNYFLMVFEMFGA